MELKEALNIIKQVCQGNVGVIDSGYKGTFQEHQILQQSIQVITRALEPDYLPKKMKKDMNNTEKKEVSDGNKK